MINETGFSVGEFWLAGSSTYWEVLGHSAGEKTGIVSVEQTLDIDCNTFCRIINSLYFRLGAGIRARHHETCQNASAVSLGKPPLTIRPYIAKKHTIISS